MSSIEPAAGQSSGKIPRIGILSFGDATSLWNLLEKAYVSAATGKPKILLSSIATQRESGSRINPYGESFRLLHLGEGPIPLGVYFFTFRCSAKLPYAHPERSPRFCKENGEFGVIERLKIAIDHRRPDILTNWICRR